MKNSISQQIDDNVTLVTRYITAVGEKRAELFPTLLHDNVSFKGTLMTFNNATDLIAAFKQLGTVVLRNEIRKIFAEENEACVIYDLILDDNLEPVSCIEWIKIENKKIHSIQLVFDSKLFLKVREELLIKRSNQK